MKKIMVIGPGGAGKSTLANKLGEELDLPVFHLDKLFWQKSWTMLEKSEREKLVRSILTKDEWVMDGNFRSTLFEERLSSADTVIFLSFPRRVTIPRWFKRIQNNRGQARPDVGRGNIERFNWGYFKVLMSNEHRYKDWEEIKRKYPNNDCRVLKSQKDVNEFMDNI